MEKITYVFETALKEANVTPEDIDLVAVTTHPGLIGSLLVGINAAKAFSLAHNIELVEVDHIVEKRFSPQLGYGKTGRGLLY